MEQVEKDILDTRKYYLKEFCYFDGECDITFNIVDIKFERKTINIAVTNRGKISVIEYDLIQDKNCDFFLNMVECTTKYQLMTLKKLLIKKEKNYDK